LTRKKHERRYRKRAEGGNTLRATPGLLGRESPETQVKKLLVNAEKKREKGKSALARDAKKTQDGPSTTRR